MNKKVILCLVLCMATTSAIEDNYVMNLLGLSVGGATCGSIESMVA